jgi:hypothetical protein
MHWTAQKQPNIYVIVGSLISYGRENSRSITSVFVKKIKKIYIFLYLLTMYVQWNLSNPTHQGTREMCRIVQDVGILRVYFSKQKYFGWHNIVFYPILPLLHLLYNIGIKIRIYFIRLIYK